MVQPLTVHDETMTTDISEKVEGYFTADDGTHRRLWLCIKVKLSYDGTLDVELEDWATRWR